MKRKLSATLFFAAVTMLGFAASAGAVDGTIEINQAKVLAAGAFRTSGCLISGNTAFNNLVCIGMDDATSGYGGNVMDNNSTSNHSGGTSLGNNLCSGTVC